MSFPPSSSALAFNPFAVPNSSAPAFNPFAAHTAARHALPPRDPFNNLAQTPATLAMPVYQQANPAPAPVLPFLLAPAPQPAAPINPAAAAQDMLAIFPAPMPPAIPPSIANIAATQRMLNTFTPPAAGLPQQPPAYPNSPTHSSSGPFINMIGTSFGSPARRLTVPSIMQPAHPANPANPIDSPNGTQTGSNFVHQASPQANTATSRNLNRERLLARIRAQNPGISDQDAQRILNNFLAHYRRIQAQNPGISDQDTQRMLRNFFNQQIAASRQPQARQG